MFRSAVMPRTTARMANKKKYGLATLRRARTPQTTLKTARVLMARYVGSSFSMAELTGGSDRMSLVF